MRNRSLARRAVAAAIAAALLVAGCASIATAPSGVARSPSDGVASSSLRASGDTAPPPRLEPATPPADSPAPPSTVRPAPTAAPVPLGVPVLSAGTTRRLQQALDETRGALSIPGVSVTIVLPDGTAWTGVSGLADVAARTPLTPDTAFALASISKTYVAALALDLVADGTIRLTDPAVTHLPDHDLDPRITVRMLLDHTSGLHDYFLNPAIDRALQARPAEIWTAGRALGFVKTRYFAPGTSWHYSNTNYLLLGLLVERVTGQSLAVGLRDRFLEPLGLTATWDQVTEQPRAPLAHGYRLVDANPGLRPADLSDGTGMAPFRSVVTAAGAAGSMAGTSADVAAWARALYGGEALSPTSLATMLAGIDGPPDEVERVPYGLGAQMAELAGHAAVGHSGRFIGFRSLMRWLPDENLSIAVLTNQSRQDPALIATRLLRILLPPPGPCDCLAPR